MNLDLEVKCYLLMLGSRDQTITGFVVKIRILILSLKTMGNHERI